MGLATAKRFVEEGMDYVFITGRRKDVLDRAVAEIGRNLVGMQGDVAAFPCDADAIVNFVFSPSCGVLVSRPRNLTSRFARKFTRARTDSVSELPSVRVKSMRYGSMLLFASDGVYLLRILQGRCLC